MGCFAAGALALLRGAWHAQGVDCGHRSNGRQPFFPAEDPQYGDQSFDGRSGAALQVFERADADAGSLGKRHLVKVLIQTERFQALAQLRLLLSDRV